YGQKLYQYSIATHQQALSHSESQSASTTPEQLANNIPSEVLFDFLERNQKNARLNEGYLGLLQRKSADYLVYCQDDTGPLGLNVQLAEKLATRIQEQGRSDQAHIQT